GHLVDRVDITERCAFARIPRRAAEEAVRLSKKRKDLPRVSFVGHASRLRNTATPAEKSTYPRRLPSGEGLREQISRRTSSSKKASGKPEDSLPPPQEHRLD
ncbi:ATP-dependent helicase, partial [Treponema pallidum]